jgi:3-hydroxybutyryl-CoA dehydrogenase
MQIFVLGNEAQKAEWVNEALEGIVWITSRADFFRYTSAGAFIDLLYENTAAHNALLAQLLPRPVIINSVMDTLAESNTSFIRINGWPTFLSSPLIEAACLHENTKANAEAVFSQLQKKPEWLPDEPGFVTARVVSMIINEAYLALHEGVSTKEEINTAMKLGTAYPFGPFEWAQKIGLNNVVALLQKLSEKQDRYTPAELLVQEAHIIT